MNRYQVIAINLDRFKELCTEAEEAEEFEKVVPKSPDDRIVFRMICAAFEVGVGPKLGIQFYKTLHSKGLFPILEIKELLKQPGEYAKKLTQCLEQIREKNPKHIDNLIKGKWPEAMEYNLNKMNEVFKLSSEKLKTILKEMDAVDFLCWLMTEPKWLKEKTASMFIRDLHDDGYKFKNYSLIDVALDSRIRRVISRIFLGFRKPRELGIRTWEEKSRYDYLIRIICRKIAQVAGRVTLDVDFSLWCFGKLCPWSWKCEEKAKCHSRFPYISNKCRAKSAEMKK